mmetsp:Transcript_11315/g.47140  ORF Transcript_11315/g.47140 Transcript_11315/m.47140 type:complete len:108 (-) Transcript_11315:2537-2860(-)
MGPLPNFSPDTLTTRLAWRLRFSKELPTLGFQLEHLKTVQRALRFIDRRFSCEMLETDEDQVTDVEDAEECRTTQRSPNPLISQATSLVLSSAVHTATFLQSQKLRL